MLGCRKVGRTSERIKCPCVCNLSQLVQRDFEPFDDPPNGTIVPAGFNQARSNMKDKWIPRLERVFQVATELLEDPDTLNPAIIICTKTTPFVPPNSRSRHVRLIFPAGPGTNIQLCANGLYELLGDRQRTKVATLFNNFMSSSLVTYKPMTPNGGGSGRASRIAGTSVRPADGKNHKSSMVQLLGVEKKRKLVAFQLWTAMCVQHGRHLNTSPGDAKVGAGDVNASQVCAAGIQSYEAWTQADCINDNPKPPGSPESTSFDFFRLSVWAALAPRLRSLTESGALRIGQMRVLDGQEERKLFQQGNPDVWVASQIFELAGKRLELRDEGGDPVSFEHRSNVGTCEVDAFPTVLEMVRKSMVESSGLDGRKAGSKMGPVNGDERTHYYSTTTPQPGSQSLLDMINHLCDDPMQLVGPGTTVQTVEQEREGFQQRLVDACLQLIPEPDRALLVNGGFEALSLAGVLASLADPTNYCGKLTCQVWHTDHRYNFYNTLAAHGVFGFLLQIPVTEEGCFMKVYDEAIGDVDGEFDGKKGKLVFTPLGSALIQPITSIHAGGIRTGPLGNPRMHLVVFLCPNSSMAAVQEDGFFPDHYTTSWIVDEPPNRKEEGSKQVRHSGKCSSTFGKKGNETRKGLKLQCMEELNELLVVLGV